jgi:hypothetical protein
MWLLRLPLTELLLVCEVHPELAKMLRRTKKCPKKMARHSKFIADSSPSANKVGMRQRVKQHGGIIPLRK